MKAALDDVRQVLPFFKDVTPSFLDIEKTIFQQHIYDKAVSDYENREI